MNIRTVVRTMTLPVAVALSVIAINLQAYVAPPMFSAETLTVVGLSVVGHAGGDQEAYPIAIPINWQLCPC